MHDASELVMLAASDHLQLVKWSFMEFWDKVKKSGRREPGHKSPMERLNHLRVSFKHKGTLPHAQTVRDLLPRVDAFCEEVTSDLLDLDFGELSLADLVGDDDVRNTLHEAEGALKSCNQATAFQKVRIAFDKLHRLIAKDAILITEPTGRDRNLHESVLESVRTLNVLMLGIDPVRYQHFISNTPRLSRSSSGLYQCIVQRDYSKVPDETFQACLEFVVEVALNAQA
jgi:hypothetical protein